MNAIARSDLMLRHAFIFFCFLLLNLTAQAFFVPFTTEQRVGAASLIAVVEVTGTDKESGFADATVIEGVLEAKAGRKVRIHDDWVDAGGSRTRIAGRDAILEKGKRYLVYLGKNKRGEWVTVQSSLDALEVIGDRVAKEGAAGFEPLAAKLRKLRTLVAEREPRPAATGEPPAEP